MITNLFKSFLIGAVSYFLASIWVGWGDLAPTIRTHNIGFILCAVGLTFWILSFVFYCIEDFIDEGLSNG